MSQILGGHESQYLYSAKWFGQIGSQFRLLSEVHIENNNLSRSLMFRTSFMEHFDILPFPQLKWTWLGARCKIVFAPCKTLPETGRYIGSENDTTENPAKVLSNLVVTLGDMDALSIKRYAPFSRLMPTLIIRKACESFEVCIYSKAQDSQIGLIETTGGPISSRTGPPCDGPIKV
jgi:hypothetical protein